MIAKHLIYVTIIRWLQGVLGIRLHYRQRYQEYLIGPRWLVIRGLRVWWDGWSCVICGARYPLQVHHTTYANRGKGWGIGEFLDCVTLCDECHDRIHREGR